jgi:hypothetical protein
MTTTISYRITKYDPLKRDATGAYTDRSEWTSISDIGKEQYGSPTYEDYERTESAYVQAIQLILKEQGSGSLRVESIELHRGPDDFIRFEQNGRLRNLPVKFDRDIAGLVNGTEVQLNGLDQIIRLVLREVLWLRLVAFGLEVKFGYDYYMYVTCGKLSPSVIAQIQQSGLFVEPDVGQRTIVVVDEDGREV